MEYIVTHQVYVVFAHPTRVEFVYQHARRRKVKLMLKNIHSTTRYIRNAQQSSLFWYQWKGYKTRN